MHSLLSDCSLWLTDKFEERVEKLHSSLKVVEKSLSIGLPKSLSPWSVVTPRAVEEVHIVL